MDAALLHQAWKRDVERISVLEQSEALLPVLRRSAATEGGQVVSEDERES